ncbi:MAG: phosphoribosylanthranilate isomerase [Candidatus Kaiserbacteria bacterium]|nr:phosphoribosylanthranilate isomerase [Candidatus Kaiserbacteria bacterium]
MTLVKICGIRSIEDALASIDAGADALGFHVELEHSKCPIDAENAARIIKELSPEVSSVVVTTLDNADAIINTADQTGGNTVQLQGDVSADVIRELKKRRPNLKVWRAVHVMGDNAAADAKKYEDLVDRILLDSMDKKTGARGGTGKTHDWSMSKKIVESVSTPVILAGGLTPGNVSEAIRTVRPYMVDVESGVSNTDGTKDIEKVKLFVERAKN